MTTRPGTTPVIISGIHGRMGQAIWRVASVDEGVELVGGLEHHSRQESGPANLRIARSLDELAPAAGCVLIEFTSPEATVEHARQAARLGLKMVVGTTGFTHEQTAMLREAGEQTALLISANMSVGVNVLLDVVRRLAGTLPGYDIEIVEMHHRLKKDAPSGTALALARSAAEGMGERLEDVIRHGREGQVGARPGREIGMHAVRGGDVVGDHTVIFAGLGERVEVTHKASSRETFAAGAVLAAKWLAGQKPGIYSMRDALEL